MRRRRSASVVTTRLHACGARSLATSRGGRSILRGENRSGPPPHFCGSRCGAHMCARAEAKKQTMRTINRTETTPAYRIKVVAPPLSPYAVCRGAGGSTTRHVVCTHALPCVCVELAAAGLDTGLLRRPYPQTSSVYMSPLNAYDIKRKQTLVNMRPLYSAAERVAFVSAYSDHVMPSMSALVEMNILQSGRDCDRRLGFAKFDASG
jgi:hypothetical protein